MFLGFLLTNRIPILHSFTVVVLWFIVPSVFIKAGQLLTPGFGPTFPPDQRCYQC